MTRRLLFTYLTISAFALAALAIPLGITFAQRERDRLYFEIERDASSVAAASEDSLQDNTPLTISSTLEHYHDTTRGRIVVVDRNGTSVADSDNPNAARQNYANRPEIRRALAGTRAIGTRHSDTAGGSLVYVAIPVASGGTVHGAVRITYPTTALDARVRDAWVRLALLCAFVLAVVAAVGFLLARSVTRPVERLEETAERFADGDLSARAPTDHGAPELRALAVTFNETAERLEQLVNAQERFVADAAHQLRSPLAALRLRIENFESQLPDSEQPKIDATVEEVARLSRIVDGLLELVRNDSEHAGIELVDVSTVVGERIDAWRGAMADQDIALAADIAAALWAAVPHGGLEQILDNLLGNALAVAPADTTVRVEARPHNKYVEVRVIDEGPGLAPDDQVRAFERFWRASPETPGTGLGLPIVRQLARRAGGDARLEVGPAGVGLAAVVELPATRPPAARTDRPGPAESLTLH
jgi:signal transduction histidine kinase